MAHPNVYAWAAKCIEDERRRLIRVIQDMSHEEWSEFLGALEVVADYGHGTPKQIEEAPFLVRHHLWQMEE